MKQSWRPPAITAAALSLMTMATAPAVASGSYSQDGYSSALGTSVTGAQASLTANNGFAPDSPACVLQAVALGAYDAAGNPQRNVETGYLRCNGMNLDLYQTNSCASGYRFVEVFNTVVGYQCFQKAAFGVGASNRFTVSRASGGDVARAYINGGAQDAQMGYAGNYARAYSMMEYTSTVTGKSCNGWGPANGYFGGWQQGSNGSWIGGSAKTFGSGGAPDSMGNCFQIGGQDAARNFTIWK